MKAIILHGSPRKNGNSDTLVQHFIRGLETTGDPEVRHFYINEMAIRPCQGCLTCVDAAGHNCAISDDMQHIYAVFGDADIVIWATPIYWGYMTAQLKMALDRMVALSWEHFTGKTFVVLITYNVHCESTVAFFERIRPYYKLRLHVITCRTFDEGRQKEIPISECKTELDEAYALGKRLGRGLG